jgi:SCY1-like protein 1
MEVVDDTVVIAGVLALAATQQYFLLSEVAIRILPALCQLTVDPEKSVRDNVFRTMKGFLGKLEKVSEDPSLRESMGKQEKLLLGVLYVWTRTLT